MLIIMIIFSIPAYIFFIWGLCEPEEAIVLMDHWGRKNDGEFSDLQFAYFRYCNIFCISLVTIVLICATISTFSVK